MTSSSRRILVFVAAGLLCAVAVGVAVWRISAPESVVSKPSAATAVSSTASSAPSTTHSYTTTATPTSTQSKQSKTNVAAPAEDPYLAPNAVVNRTEPVGPTAVYRPDNVSSLQNQQPQATPNNPYPQAPVSMAPAVPPTDGSTPASETPIPGTPQQSSEPTQPSATPESQTAVPQEGPVEDQDGSQPAEQPQPKEPTPSQNTGVPEPLGSFIPHPAGFTQNAPAPDAEPKAQQGEPIDVAPQGGEVQGADVVEAVERESAAYRTNEAAPTPAAPTDDAPAAAEPSAATPTAAHLADNGETTAASALTQSA
ncbi:DNA-directed RNA polymerase II [Corynebacterium sp. HMSC056E09]|uniref:DNA-directed RNA polymerase II n=1 Tax=unclassified Corynebacterium TaxID=2624378 RepID=UPI0008A44914|nr:MULTISPECIES: DNA-directed RNA polymerase II [unclassified Corynebacterium]OFL60410.1 DNA-directed RNA polymerase II [Corynebacterium sp. HMSC065D07]OFQ94249.1 DNA-directed RNA polymerase II [Corynebacterium sp. HMSC056E09]